jgi:iron complex transport system substrate-binding protein
MYRSIRRSFTGVAVAAALALTACGSDTKSAGNATATTIAATTSAAPTTTAAPVATFPVTIHTGTGDVLVKAKPTKIVSLSPTGTEMLFAIGAGPQVLAVDDQSTYPADAPKTDLSGFQPNVEAIAKYAPDLVVVSDDSAGLTASLGPLGVAVLVEPSAMTLDETYTQLEQLGQATGNPAGAEAAVTKMRDGIAAIVKTLPKRATPLSFYHELDDTLYSVTSKTFIGQVYALLGLTNVADAADKTGSGYPQLSSEYLVTADPDVIFLADTKCCKQDATTLAARPGFAQLKAVKNGNVVLLDDDVASRWGPRVVDFLHSVVDAVAKLPAGG